jgi:glycosyltransferase involved in cell wall biosynthesis
MKILHITTSSKGGAGIAALRLHAALCESNITSGYLSLNLTLNFDNQVVNDMFFKSKKQSICQRVMGKIKTILFSSKKKNKKKYKIIKDKLNCEISTLPFSNYLLHNHPMVLEADIINLHWVSGIIDYPSFFKNCKKPIVWTLHDMNPLQGIFHYKEDQNRNSNIIKNFDEEIKVLKTNCLKYVKKGVIVSPSKWLLDEALQTDVFKSFSYRCIPNSLNLDIFNLKNKVEIRREFSISEEDFVILFIADSLKNPRKGFDLLIEALLNLKALLPLTVLAIGKGIIPEIDNIKILSLGELKDADEIAKCYSIADVFLLPSREDNLPNVMIEAFACGLPVISFSNGGMKEHIKLNVNGMIIEDINGKALSDGIMNFYNNRNLYKSSAIRKYAEDNFKFSIQAASYLKVYNEILKL